MSKIGAGSAFGPAPLVLALVALSGCGGSQHALPTCATPKQHVQPPSIPLPDGTVISSRRRRLGSTVWSGVAPGSLDDVRASFVKRLRSAGYDISGGGGEEHDAEAEVEGNGVRGRLKLRDVAGCSGAVSGAIATRGQ